MRNSALVILVLLQALKGLAGDNCKPVSVVVSFNDYAGNKREYTRIWQYDESGRVVLDSINSPDSVWAAPLYTEHYSYKDDSVIGQGRYTGIMAIAINADDKAPAANLLPGKVNYNAVYADDGTLKKVTVTRPGINDRGKPVASYSTIDSIEYYEGNIIAYRFYGMVSYKVYCTYYKDSLYKQPFNPTDRLLALIGRPDEVPGYLNVQVFSKELLRTEENAYTKTYTYQLDDKGRVLAIDRSYNSGVEGAQTTVTHYAFNYDCK